MLVKITTKHASYSLVTFVTHKRFAVLFFLPSRCVNSLVFSIMVNDIRPVYPEPNLLLKYADDLTLSVPVSAHQDHSLIEVNSIQHRAVRNRTKLNLG